VSNPPRVLVIYKKSAFQLYIVERKNPLVQRLLREGDPSVSRLRQAHDDHLASVARAKKALARLGARAMFRYRRDSHAADEFDLILTLGGDGTLLSASHMVPPGRPMLAINTAPKDSVGFFCAASGDDVEQALADALGGKLKDTELTRMRIERDDEVLSTRILNDALFCHEVPAATSRYILGNGRLQEEQKSSGIWVGPAAGSTAAQRSAGGRVLAIESPLIQWVVREPYEPYGIHYQLEKGVLEPGDTLELRNKMRNGKLYLDGPHVRHDVQLGAVLRMTQSEEPLTLLGLRRRKELPATLRRAHSAHRTRGSAASPRANAR
jgi:NAD+ kinase